MDKEEYIDQEHLEHWLREFGMPEGNIQDCITQIAQGYGACRYLEGVQDGADAVNEIGEKAEKDASEVSEEYEKDFKKEVHNEAIKLNTAPCYDELYNYARHFANWQKVQMMKEAINAVVESDLDPHGADYGLQKIKIEYMKLESLRFKPNTPVKIIILKEE